MMTWYDRIWLESVCYTANWIMGVLIAAATCVFLSIASIILFRNIALAQLFSGILGFLFEVLRALFWIVIGMTVMLGKLHIGRIRL